MNPKNRYFQYFTLFAIGALLSVMSGVVFYFAGDFFAFPLPMAILAGFFILAGIVTLYLPESGRNYYLAGLTAAGLALFFGGGFFYPPGNIDSEYKKSLAIPLSLQPSNENFAVLIIADAPAPPLAEDLANLDWVSKVDVVISGAIPENPENPKIQYFNSLASLPPGGYELTTVFCPLSITGQYITRSLAGSNIWAIPQKFAREVHPDDILLSGYWLVSGKYATDNPEILGERLAFADRALNLIDLDSLFAIMPENKSENNTKHMSWSLPSIPADNRIIWIAIALILGYFAAHLFWGGKGQGVYYFQSFENGIATTLLLFLMMATTEEYRVFNYYYGGLAALTLMTLWSDKVRRFGRRINLGILVVAALFFVAFPSRFLIAPLSLLTAIGGGVAASDISDNAGQKARTGKFALAGIAVGALIFLSLSAYGASTLTIFWVALGLKSFYLLKT